ncbi:MAG: alanine dehydrogenase [bacterium]
MIIGVPKEIKPQENRVALVPGVAGTLIERGHTVLVQAGAGAGSGFGDEDYAAKGARVVSGAAEVFAEAQLIVKVKEPLESETPLLKQRQILFTYLHLAPNPELTRSLLESGCSAIAYETVTGVGGGLPLLTPMSAVAGRLAVQAGARCLEKHMGGRGVLLGGIAGVRPGRVMILGGGTVGANAAQMAVGLGADVVLLDNNPDVLAQLELSFQGRLKTVFSTHHALAAELEAADLMIGAVLAPGGLAPKLVTRAMVASMRPGSAVVDVAIDQGGCLETSRPTSHADPTYIEEGVVHYCVANIPGAVPHTSTIGLTNATYPYLLALADGGLDALRDDPGLAAGLNVHRGRVRHRAVAEATGLPFEPYAP